MLTVKGKLVDDQSRCVHYHSTLDIIAIKFKCCNDYYPCYYCHKESTDHPVALWKKVERYTKAILCGMCKNEMSIAEYINSNNKCPYCSCKFNPACSHHYHLYFEI